MKYIKSLFSKAPINNEIGRGHTSVAQGSTDDIEDGTTNHGKRKSS